MRVDPKAGRDLAIGIAMSMAVSLVTAWSSDSVGLQKSMRILGRNEHDLWKAPFQTQVFLFLGNRGIVITLTAAAVAVFAFCIYSRKIYPRYWIAWGLLALWNAYTVLIGCLLISCVVL